jgi:hypothetical protein
MTLHEADDPVCLRRRTERFQDQPSAACRVYINPRLAELLMRDEGFTNADFTDHGDSDLSLRVLVRDESPSGFPVLVLGGEATGRVVILEYDLPSESADTPPQGAPEALFERIVFSALSPPEQDVPPHPGTDGLESSEDLFETLAEPEKALVLSQAGPELLHCTSWARNHFVAWRFCGWRCGSYLTFHSPDDPECRQRRRDRRADCPDTGLVYLPRLVAEGLVTDGHLEADDFTEVGEDWVSLCVAVPGGPVMTIGHSFKAEISLAVGMDVSGCRRPKILVRRVGAPESSPSAAATERHGSSVGAIHAGSIPPTH